MGEWNTSPTLPRTLDINDSCARIYINWLASMSKRLSVSLDGVEQQRVVAYDCDSGWIEKHALDGDGRPIVEAGRVKIERVTGAVSVSLVDKEFQQPPFPCLKISTRD